LNDISDRVSQGTEFLPQMAPIATDTETATAAQGIGIRTIDHLRVGFCQVESVHSLRVCCLSAFNFRRQLWKPPINVNCRKSDIRATSRRFAGHLPILLSCFSCVSWFNKIPLVAAMPRQMIRGQKMAA
jgi:hypothetical protein